MIKPNFFIVGAPKCGTTSLSEYLRDHPNIFVSKPKEPQYFSEDFPKLRFVTSLDNYLKLFEKSSDKHLAVGEASATYLYSSVAINRIYQFNKKAKIIAILRNPVDMVYSLHSQFIYDFAEDEKEFETAWRLQSQRKKGVSIPKTCKEPLWLQYLEVGQLGFQIERLLSIFPPQQVKIILFDDFVRSTKSVYEDVLSFLGVPSDGRTDFPRINVNKEFRFDRLGLFIQNPPRFLYYFADKWKKIFGLEEITLRHKLRELATRRTSRKPLDPDFRAELVEEFKEDVDKLSRILGRDLSHWSK
jgi:hypothetical protein